MELATLATATIVRSIIAGVAVSRSPLLVMFVVILACHDDPVVAPIARPALKSTVTDEVGA